MLKVSNGVVYKAVATCDKDTLAPSAGAMSNHSSSSCKLNNAVRTSPIISQKYTQDEQKTWTCDFDGKLPRKLRLYRSCFHADVDVIPSVRKL